MKNVWMLDIHTVQLFISQDHWSRPISDGIHSHSRNESWAQVKHLVNIHLLSCWHLNIKPTTVRFFLLYTQWEFIYRLVFTFKQASKFQTWKMDFTDSLISTRQHVVLTHAQSSMLTCARGQYASQWSLAVTCSPYMTHLQSRDFYSWFNW